MNPKLPEREMPVVYRHILSAEWVREFPLKDRIKILFGATLKVVIKIATANSPGKFQPVIAGEVSNLMTARAHLKEQMKQVLVEQKR